LNALAEARQEELKGLFVNFRNMYGFLSQVIPYQDEEIRLSELIEMLTERFGTEFTQADQLFFDQIQEEAVADEKLRQSAAVNTVDDFRYVFSKAFEGLVIERMEGNEEIFSRLMSDEEFRKMASEHLLHKVYSTINSK